MDTQESVIKLFRFNNSLFENKVFSLSDAEADKRISDAVNPAKWLAGHLASSRNHVLNLLGVDREFRYEETFKGGYDASKDYPSMADLRDEFNDITTQLFTELDKVSDTKMEKELGYDLPHGAKTVGESLPFWLYHEAWHVGQIAIIRRSQNMEGVVPY